MGAALAVEMPILTRLVALLGAGLGTVAIVEARRSRPLTSGSLFVRWRTWAVITPVFAIASATAVTTVGLVCALAAQGCREYARLVGLPRGLRSLLVVAAVAAPVLAAVGMPIAVLVGGFLLGASLLAMSCRDVERGTRDLAMALLGYLWIPLGLHALVVIRLDGGAALLIAVATAVALSDVGAFVVGSKWGRRPLAPALSPGKTRAGVVGNAVGAALGFLAIAGASSVGLPLWATVACPAVIAVGAVWGDLLESLVKRSAGVKDAGDLLPGFGGVLDRVDSLLIVAPLVAGVVLLSGASG